MGHYTDNLRKRLRNPLPPEVVAMIARQARSIATSSDIAATTPLKGQFDGNCNRTACQTLIAGANFWNTSTRAYYCGQCARDINHWSRRDDNQIICLPVTDPVDQPRYGSERGVPPVAS